MAISRTRLTHALSIKTEEIMGLLLDDIESSLIRILCHHFQLCQKKKKRKKVEIVHDAKEGKSSKKSLLSVLSSHLTHFPSQSSLMVSKKEVAFAAVPLILLRYLTKSSTRKSHLQWCMKMISCCNDLLYF